MKKISTLTLAMMSMIPAVFSQNNNNNPDKGKIEVSSTSEREVTPDIIYINISLREYFENNNTKKRVSITTLENQLVQTTKKLGIDQKDITINSLNGYMNSVNRRKNPEFLDSKNYKIKLSNLNNYNELIDGVDPKGLVYSNVIGYEYSKKEEVKAELRAEATKSAKKKAQNMVTALDAKVGKILFLTENSSDEGSPLYPRVQMMMTKTSINDEAQEQAPELDFKTIKMKVTVNASFEINE